MEVPEGDEKKIPVRSLHEGGYYTELNTPISCCSSNLRTDTASTSRGSGMSGKIRISLAKGIRVLSPGQLQSLETGKIWEENLVRKRAIKGIPKFCLPICLDDC